VDLCLYSGTGEYAIVNRLRIINLQSSKTVLDEL